MAAVVVDMNTCTAYLDNDERRYLCELGKGHYPGSPPGSPHVSGSRIWDDQAFGAGYEGVAQTPDYYQGAGMQPFDVIDAFGLDFYAGNVIKYLFRAGKKGPALSDLEKARHYIDRMIERAKQQ